MICKYCDSANADGATRCKECGRPLDCSQDEDKRSKHSMPMKWFYFTIYAQLFIIILLELWTTVWVFRVGLYHVALVAAVDVVLAVVARQMLAHYKSSGPMMLRVFRIYSVVASVILSLITGVGLSLGGIGASLAMVVFEASYYSRRSMIFCE